MWVVKSILVVFTLIFMIHSYGIDLSLDTIDQYLYGNEKIYLTYKNDTPHFYIGERQEYYLIPPYIKADDTIAPMIKKLGFKLNNSTYNIIITYKDITPPSNKVAIIFSPINGSNVENRSATIFWVVDPLKIKQSNVYALYSFPKTGKVIAVYDDGKPAIIRVDNKIYVGCKPNEDVLANLIYLIIIRRSGVPFYYLLLVVLIATISLLMTFQEALKKKFLDVISFLASLKVAILARVNIFDEEKVLSNKTRQEIYNYILENPGSHLREISKNLNKPTSTIAWHLRILEKAELIKSERLGNKIIYLPVEMDVKDLPKLYLRNETQKKIFNYLLKNPAHLRKIAKDLNLNVETVRYNLKKMENVGIVETREDGNKIIYYISRSFFDKSTSSTDK
ncbi:winged helix-turn-helix transcriptional regulator [Methanocaldococcus sp.]